MFAVVAPMTGAAFAADVPSLIAWRFFQGLLLPPIFAVTMAYIGDEWPAAEIARTVRHLHHGFQPGRLFRALRAGHSRRSHRVARRLYCARGPFAGWRCPGDAAAAGGKKVRALARRERLGAADASASREPAARGDLCGRLRRAVQLHRDIHLSQLPSRRAAVQFFPGDLGAIFVTYLAGAAIAPSTGWLLAKLGRRAFVVVATGAWACGCLLTLAPSVPVIVAGLTLCAACGMLCQTVSTSYVTAIAKEGRSAAVGLYVTSFYIGGSLGAFLPGLAGRPAGGLPASPWPLPCWPSWR